MDSGLAGKSPRPGMTAYDAVPRKCQQTSESDPALKTGCLPCGLTLLFMQPWYVSRFYGQLSMLEARIRRAGAILATTCPSSGEFEASIMRARYEGLLDLNYISRMRICLGVLAVTALAALCLILA